MEHGLQEFSPHTYVCQVELSIKQNLRKGKPGNQPNQKLPTLREFQFNRLRKWRMVLLLLFLLFLLLLDMCIPQKLNSNIQFKFGFAYINVHIQISICQPIFIATCNLLFVFITSVASAVIHAFHRIHLILIPICININITIPRSIQLLAIIINRFHRPSTSVFLLQVNIMLCNNGLAFSLESIMISIRTTLMPNFKIIQS